MNRNYRTGMVGLLVFASALAGCHEKSVRPGVNDAYKDAEVDVWTGRFERESREIFAHRDKIVQAIAAKPGMDVADVGAGTGLFTMLLAERVGPSGTVRAVDITPEFLAHIDRRAREAGLTNVETVRCAEDSVSLPRNSVDLVFSCDTYHHLEFPLSTMRSIREALRPGGELIIIEFDRVEGESRDWIMGHVRAGREIVRKEIISAGFEWIEDTPTPYLKENYFARFRRTD